MRMTSTRGHGLNLVTLNLSTMYDDGQFAAECPCLSAHPNNKPGMASPDLRTAYI